MGRESGRIGEERRWQWEYSAKRGKRRRKFETFASASAMLRIGQFLADHGHPIKAHSYFLRALHMEPGNEVAMSANLQFLPSVEQYDQCLLKRVFEKHQQLCQHLQSAQGVQQVKVHLRAAFYEYIYQTCRMEDNQMSLEEVRKLLIGTGGEAEGREALEIEGAARAFIQTILAVQVENGGFSDELFFKLHQILMEKVEPGMAGRIVCEKNEREECEMGVKKMIQWINGEMETKLLDPITLAALTHFYVVLLHVFPDGNGRLCRLWMNLLLMRAGFPPIIIPADTEQQKQAYFALLCAAINGDLRPFVRYIAKNLLNTMEKLMQPPVDELLDCPRADLLVLMMDFLSIHNPKAHYSTSSSANSLQQQKQNQSYSSSGIGTNSTDISPNWAKLFRMALTKEGPS